MCIGRYSSPMEHLGFIKLPHGSQLFTTCSAGSRGSLAHHGPPWTVINSIKNPSWLSWVRKSTSPDKGKSRQLKGFPWWHLMPLVALSSSQKLWTFHFDFRAFAFCPSLETSSQLKSPCQSIRNLLLVGWWFKSYPKRKLPSPWNNKTKT